ncbi:MAG: hypothetical protein RR571_07585 [Anaerorhabdus sp.]|uniref:hypothetical protein n=1 Tax=Anaerorhabdus sp. TaxID=1872524 RepID=UPI002FC88DFC
MNGFLLLIPFLIIWFGYLSLIKIKKSNLEKIKTIDSDTYNQEQIEKREILEFLLEHYNDGRRKTFYCLAINLLELNDIRSVIKSSEQLKSNERINFIVNSFNQLALE